MSTLALAARGRAPLLALLIVAQALPPAHADVVYPEWVPGDSTSTVQAALDDLQATEVVLTATPTPWFVAPLEVDRNDLVITLRPGAVVHALGGYGNTDSVFTVIGQHDIVFSGYGATIQMPGYSSGEHRHGISLKSCTNVTVAGLTIRDTGGDGIYVGSSSNEPQPFCDIVRIVDVTVIGSRRSGSSLISGRDVTYESCVFRDTLGTPTEAGLKLEPNNPSAWMSGVKVKGCFFDNNHGPGIGIGTPNLAATSEPIDVKVESCWVRSSGKSGVKVVLSGTPGVEQVPASLSFTNLLVEQIGTAGQGNPEANAGIYVKCQAKASAVAFKNCIVRDALASSNPEFTPVRIDGVSDPLHTYGGIVFTDCVVYDRISRPFLRCKPNPLYEDITGNFTVINPFPEGAVPEYPASAVGVDLAVDAWTASPSSIVNINAIDGVGAESGPDTISLRVKRSSAIINFPLAVTYSPATGTAINGLDYAFLHGLTIIPRNLIGKTVDITPRADGDPAEGTETATLSLLPSSYYAIGSGSSVTATIADGP